MIFFVIFMINYEYTSWIHFYMFFRGVSQHTIIDYHTMMM
jgi:hypothetical protein